MVSILDPEFRNYISALRGMSYVGIQVEEYTRKGLEKVHRDIYNQTAGNTPCSEQCSARYGGQTASWCQNCQAWMNLLKNTRRRMKTPILWENTESWMWPTSYENIIEIYLPEWWSKTTKPILKDIGTVCHIWNNCKEYNLRPFVTPNLQKVRNKYVAHNSKELKLTENEASEVIDALEDLIKDPEVIPHVKVQTCLKELQNIHARDELCELIGENTKQINQQNIAINDIQLKISQIVEAKIVLDFKMLKLFSKYSLPEKATLVVSAIVVCFIGLLVCIPSPDPNVSRQSHGCVSEIYSFPYPQDMPLLGYLREHKQLVGREWLFDELEHDLLQRDNGTNGLILIGDMGVGKSAIISHLLCTENGMKGYSLRKHIVAFHICKFNVQSTRKPVRFVRRIVGFLSTKWPAFGSLISKLPEAAILFSDEKCANNLEACFDQGITLPLNELDREYNEKMEIGIFVIDGLDECFENEVNTNPIKDIIFSRLRDFPRWVKFLITSRNDRFPYSMGYERKHLHSNDSNNMDDIKRFIQGQLEVKLTGDDIHTLVNQSGGIFSFVVFALEHIVSNGSLGELPSSLDELYDLNFKRHFPFAKDYILPKAILEIISASLSPMVWADVRYILSMAITSYVNSELDGTLKRMSHFLRDETKMVIIHQSLYEWLISSRNINFKIDLKEGHSLIARHLLKTIEAESSSRFTDLLISVIGAEDLTLISNFKSSNFSLIPSDGLLIDLVRRTCSTTALEFYFHHFHNINEYDVKEDETPAYIVAAKGNVGQLKLLHEKGANFSFLKQRSKCTSTSKILHITFEYERKPLCEKGFGLMHIATKNGHVDMVQYLLHVTPSQMHQKTISGHYPFHIACDYGHGELFDILRQYQNSSVVLVDCLYYAAASNHLEIAQSIKPHCQDLKCISESKSKQEKDNFFKTVCDVFSPMSYICPTFIPAIEWAVAWKIYQDTALHVAVRHNALKIASYLIEVFPHLLKCRNALGYTPALLIIRFNMSELVPKVIEYIITDTCEIEFYPSNHGEYIFHRNKVNLERDIELYGCTNGSTFAHVIAKYHRHTLMQMVYDYNSSLDWNMPDAIGNRPLHYAGMSDNVFFIRSCTILGIDIRTRALNGSTVHHIAALHANLASMQTLTHQFSVTLDGIRDNGNKGVLHYLVVLESNVLNVNIIDKKETNRNEIFRQLIVNNNISETDIYKRNILHYIIFNGHSLLLKTLFIEKGFAELSPMLLAVDVDGLTPIQFGLNNSAKADPFRRRNTEKDYFTLSESINEISIWENGLVGLIKNVPNNEVNKHVLPSMSLLIQRAPFATNALFYYHVVNITSSEIVKSLLGQNKLRKIIAPMLSLYFIYLKRPDLIYVCGKHLSVSPLHFFLLNKMQKENKDYYLRVLNYEGIIHPNSQGRYLRDTDTHYLHDLVSHGNLNKMANCDDDQGLNLFHYALIGGNIADAHVILHMERNNIVNQRITSPTVLFLSQMARYQPYLGHHDDYTYREKRPTQIEVTDELMSSLLKREYVLNLTAVDVCRNGSMYLSIVHILALNGMTDTLKVMTELLGEDIVKCYSKEQFSPLHFAKMFERRETINLLETYDEYRKPNVDSLAVLALHIGFDFPRRRVREQNIYNCFRNITGKFPSNERGLRKMFDCLKNIRKTYSTECLSLIFVYDIYTRVLMNLFYDYLVFKKHIATERSLTINVENITMCAHNIFKHLHAIYDTFNSESLIWTLRGHISWHKSLRYMKKIFSFENSLSLSLWKWDEKHNVIYMKTLVETFIGIAVIENRNAIITSWFMKACLECQIYRKFNEEYFYDLHKNFDGVSGDKIFHDEACTLSHHVIDDFFRSTRFEVVRSTMSIKEILWRRESYPYNLFKQRSLYCNCIDKD